jgi:hypothetical protein
MIAANFSFHQIIPRYTILVIQMDQIATAHHVDSCFIKLEKHEHKLLDKTIRESEMH